MPDAHKNPKYLHTEYSVQDTGTKIIPLIIQANHPELNREPKSAKYNSIQKILEDQL